MLWATRQLSAARADEGFYRICGVTGSGKSHLTKLFILDALREVEANPDAKLIVYEPKREFYAWLLSLGLTVPITYFMPSDVRSVALDFARDYQSDVDSLTLAHAFYPLDPGDRQRFWGDAMRTIYAQVYDAIKGQLGYADLRVMCLVLEDETLTQKVLGHDPYLVQARKLVGDHSDAVGETKRDIQYTIHSRIAEMKVMAAHLEHARRDNGPFSLRDFVRQPRAGVFVVSKDETFKKIQDPMNGVLFLRLTEILDAEQQDRRRQDKKRKIFIVIDEFPTLAGDKPCPGITDMFLRLRSRGVSILITYQALTSLQRIYGQAATETIGQCKNVTYLRQSDVSSADYAAEDLGRRRGFEKVNSFSFGSGGNSWGMTQHQHWFDRTICSPTELRELPTASPERGVKGWAKSSEAGEGPWCFTYPPEFIDRIPETNIEVEEYVRRGEETQRLAGLTDEERNALLGQTPEEAERAKWSRLDI